MASKPLPASAYFQADTYPECRGIIDDLRAAGFTRVRDMVGKALGLTIEPPNEPRRQISPIPRQTVLPIETSFDLESTIEILSSTGEKPPSEKPMDRQGMNDPIVRPPSQRPVDRPPVRRPTDVPIKRHPGGPQPSRP